MDLNVHQEALNSFEYNSTHNVSLMKKYWVIILISFYSINSHAQTAEQKYVEYLQTESCSSSKNSACLKLTSYMATRADGRRVKVDSVFDYIEKPNKHLFTPHFLLGYMRLLRNAYSAKPRYGNQLFNQIDFIISRAVNRNGALVWENQEGIAQGMEQAEFAAFFASAANTFKANADIKSAKGIMTYALKFIRSIDIQAGIKTGGVSSITTYCGCKTARLRPCYWFHSRGLGVEDAPGVRTVLNQHLHVINDILSLYLSVYESPELIAPQFGSPKEVLDFLENKAIGGLYQLAFSEGHKNHTAPNRPPNIKQFMNYKHGVKVKATPDHPDGNPLNYYRSYYEFNMSTGKGNNISPERTCHYHTHVLKMMADIKNLLDDNKEIFNATKEGWRLYEAMDALFAGKGEAIGMKESSHTIYQFYRSEAPAFKDRRENCDTDDSLSNDYQIFYKNLFD